MTNQQILTKAIQKAIDGGFKWIPQILNQGNRVYIAFNGEQFDVVSVIFSHDFAKALWGDDNYGNTNVDAGAMHIIKRVKYTPAWEVHLMLMVISDDPIKYLGENLD